LCTLKQSVGQRSLAMIDMSNDTKVANLVCFHHKKVNPLKFLSTKEERERLSERSLSHIYKEWTRIDFMECTRHWLPQCQMVQLLILIWNA